MSERYRTFREFYPFYLTEHANLVSRRICNLMDGELQPDFRIWENKKYLESPGLAQGDGPIGRYRKWASQFYADRRAARKT